MCEAHCWVVKDNLKKSLALKKIKHLKRTLTLPTTTTVVILHTVLTYLPSHIQPIFRFGRYHTKLSFLT